MNNVKKTQTLESLSDLLKTNKNFTVLKFGATTHQSFEALRKNLKKSKSSLQIVKNSLFTKTVNRMSSKNKLFKNLGKKFFPLKDNSALVLLPDTDWNNGLSLIQNAATGEKTISFKFSLLDEVVYDEENTKKIANLPSKNILAGKVISSLKSPVYKFIYSLKYPAQKLTYILSAKAGKH